MHKHSSLASAAVQPVWSRAGRMLYWQNGKSPNSWASSYLGAGGLWGDSVREGLRVAAGAAVAPSDGEAHHAGLVRRRVAAVDPPLQPGGRYLLLPKHDADGAAGADLSISLSAGHQHLRLSHAHDQSPMMRQITAIA